MQSKILMYIHYILKVYININYQNYSAMLEINRAKLIYLVQSQ